MKFERIRALRISEDSEKQATTLHTMDRNSKATASTIIANGINPMWIEKSTVEKKSLVAI